VELLRNMARRRLRSALTILGIVIGVLALTVMGGMVEYFNVLLDAGERLGGTNVDVQPATRSADDQLTILTMRRLRQVDGVADVANVLTGLLTDENINVSFGPPDTVYGVEPHLARSMFPGTTLQSGRWLEAGDSYHVVLGSRIATNKGLAVGDVLTWRKKEYRVVGVMARTNTVPDGMAVIPFPVARKELKLPLDTVGGLSVVPAPGVDPEALAARINQEVPRVKARSPRQAIDEIRQALAVFNAIMLGGALIAVVVGGLSVINTMIMAVKERTREVGVRKAIGATDGDIIREFLGEATVMGVVGGLVGLWLGWALTTALNRFAAPGMGGTEIWMITPRLMGFVLLFASVLGAVAGLIPAWTASRLNPVEALRAE
jgi:putative ABC transport system permease protein